MNDAEQRALPIPPAIAEAAELAPEAHELIRAWWDGERTRMMIRTTFDHPAQAGIILSELAWHFANAYAERRGQDRDTLLGEIRAAWSAQHARYDAEKTDLVAEEAEGAERS